MQKPVFICLLLYATNIQMPDKSNVYEYVLYMYIHQNGKCSRDDHLFKSNMKI